MEFLSNVTLDNSTKVATVIIALFNVLVAIRVFLIKDKKDDKHKESDRKIQLMKTLVLDHNLDSFYKIFDDMLAELSKLRNIDVSDQLKQEVNDKVEDHFISLRRKFYDLFLAIDISLYNKLKTQVDEIQGEISTTIFDSGINLSHLPKFEEVFTERITQVKTSMIKDIFLYRGSN